MGGSSGRYTTLITIMSTKLTRKEYFVDIDEQKTLLQDLESRTDADGLRMKRFLNMPDLTRAITSPIAEIVERVKNLPGLKDFDIITIPEIVPADISFDLFDFQQYKGREIQGQKEGLGRPSSLGRRS